MYDIRFRYGSWIIAAFIFGSTSMAWGASKVYVPLGSANEILVVDVANDSVVGNIKGMINVHGLAATSDGKTLVAGSLTEQRSGQAPPIPKGMSEQDHRGHHSASIGDTAAQEPGISIVSIINAVDRQVIRRIEVKGSVHHVAVTPDGRYAITTHTKTGKISVIDIPGRKVIKQIVTGPLPNYALVTKDSKLVYVSNAGNNTVSVIDTQHWVVQRNIPAGNSPEHMALSPDEKTLYVNSVSAGITSVISLDKGAVVKTYSIGESPHGMALSEDGATLFVSSKKENKLVAINLTTGKTRTLALFPAPYHLTMIPGTEKLYVSSREQSKIWVVDQESLKVTGEIALRGEGHQMVFTP